MQKRVSISCRLDEPTAFTLRKMAKLAKRSQSDVLRLLIASAGKLFDPDQQPMQGNFIGAGGEQYGDS